MKTIAQFHQMLEEMGSDVLYHREDGGTVCPCRTPEGDRDPAWHRAHPTEPLCNEEGMLANVTSKLVKASIQPATLGQRGRAGERVNALLGEVQRDDHFGIFPVKWGGITLDFSTFTASGDDYILYDGRRFLAVASDKIPDVDGDANHHWEVGLRLVKTGRPVDE